MSTGELDERRRADGRERARLFGEEFHLGTLQRVSRSRDLSKSAGWGGLLGVIVFLIGLPVVSGVGGSSNPLAAKVIVAVVAGGLFTACCVLFGVGLARSPVKNRLFRYSGGLAQLVADEPEPRVARWADVRDFTVDYFESDDSYPRLTDFRLTTYAGATLPGLRGYRRREEVRTVVAEAGRVLGPRLVPAMTEAYESGAPVSFGRVKVSQEGITVSGWTEPGEPIPWPQVKSIHLTYIRRKDGDFVHEVIVGQKSGPTREIRVSGLANGIFLPRLLAYAAARQGVMVTGYRKEGGGVPGG